MENITTRFRSNACLCPDNFQKQNMGDDSTFYKGVFLMVFAFGTGFGVGYKVMRSVQYISFSNLRM